MHMVLRIARKEFAGFFSSATAFIFFAAFIAVTLFVFFWVETFFARNIADVRPLFEWMPLLLIFLVAAVTMRMWSEERRSGTLEFLLTVPVKGYQLVLGKFVACLWLVSVAMLLTLPLPITVSLLGPLDWGPVLGGYIAIGFLAAAYTAIGLFVSARSANQIVSLILTVMICGTFYLLGSDALTGLFDNRAMEFLKLLGTGSRFDSISRGVIDLRDLYYYLSLVATFLTLNVFALEWLRWAGNPGNAAHRRWSLITGLLVTNFLLVNVWLAPVSSARMDLTQRNLYTLSDTTREYLGELQEPMLIRGYFSAQTHPLLAPLVPRLRDLLDEYARAAAGQIRVEFIDPQQHPQLEKEANEKYDIKPVPFQFASKYQATVVNSYFNILIEYGDQHLVLDFSDLIEVRMQSEADLEIELRNPEYDLTQAIKKILYAHQSSGNLFKNIAHPIIFNGYISEPDNLPAVLRTFRETLDTVLGDWVNRSGGTLTIDIRDPDAADGVLAEQLKSEFGFRPMVTSVTDSNSFWFYMTLAGNGRVVQVPLPAQFDKAGLERAIEAAFKRFSRGFLKTLAVHTPASTLAMFGMPASGKRFDQLKDILAGQYNLASTDLKNGRVPDAADLLLLVAPDKPGINALFAADQFLMRGGTVVMVTSPFDIDIQDRLTAQKHDSAWTNWLGHHGITLVEKMVLDPQNAAFPIPIERRVAGLVFRETKMVSYPYFGDIRGAGIVPDSGMTEGIDQVTMTWPSPIALDPQQNQGRKVTPLLQSSDQAWTSDSLGVEPDYELHGELGFPVGDQRGVQLLAVAVEGHFDSYFKDKPSPLLTTTDEMDGTTDTEAIDVPASGITRVIERSPATARIIVFASRSFLTDTMLDLAASSMGTRYLKPLQLVENAIDWSLEDRGLLALRGRAHFSRILNPLDRESQLFWEYLNYGMPLVGLFLIALLRRAIKKRAISRYASIATAVNQRE